MKPLHTIIHPIFKAGDVARAGKCAFFSLEVELKDGRDLAARDKTGTCIFNTPVMKKNISSLFDIVSQQHILILDFFWNTLLIFKSTSIR